VTAGLAALFSDGTETAGVATLVLPCSGLLDALGAFAGPFPEPGSACDPLTIASEWLATSAPGRVGWAGPDPITDVLGMTMTTVRVINTRTCAFTCRVLLEALADGCMVARETRRYIGIRVTSSPE
jgi:hypothetical protein